MTRIINFVSEANLGKIYKGIQLVQPYFEYYSPCGTPLQQIVRRQVAVRYLLRLHTASGFRNSFVRRNVDQANYHLRNRADRLTLPRPKRELVGPACFSFDLSKY